MGYKFEEVVRLHHIAYTSLFLVNFRLGSSKVRKIIACADMHREAALIIPFAGGIAETLRSAAENQGCMLAAPWTLGAAVPSLTCPVSAKD